MAEKAEIEVVISPDGEVRLETRGLRGQACVAETKDLLPALGRVLHREKTREYYQQDRTASRTTTRRR
jgi:hypothetical protein